MFGKTYMEIYPRYPDILGNWRRIRIAAGMPDLLRLLSPALAVADVIERIVRQPSMLAYVGTIPGQLLGMWAWYHGAAAALRHYREPAVEEL